MNSQNSIVNSYSIYSKNKKKNFLFANLLFFICFLVTITSFIFLVAFIIINGASFFSLDLFSFKNLSILPELINTIYVELLALFIAIPTGLGAAIYLTQYDTSKKFLLKLLNFSVEILASVPSLLFGLFGYNLFCQMLGLKCSILAGSLTMAICVLPTIVQTTKQALNSVPKSFQQAALAVGASKLKTIFNIIVPCATPGILTGIILAAGKIIGESAALLLTTGTSTKLPSHIFNHIFSSGQTLSLHLYFIAGNSVHSNATKICFAIATILLILTLTLNLTSKILANYFAK